jgi:hypothetical protein
LVCRNICERIYSKKISFGIKKQLFSLRRNTVEDVKFTYMYYNNEGMFCPSGMQLRLTPCNREGKDRLRQERRIAKITN